jgi:DNA polymerase/3'-5' exonuclease PolX
MTDTRRYVFRLLAALAAMVAVVSFVACGGDDAMSKDDYKKEAQKISDKVDADFQAALPNATSSDPEKSLAGVNQIKVAAQDAADKLEDLDPPSDYKDVQGKLVGSLRTVQKHGEEVDAAVKAKDKQKAGTAVEALQQSIKDLDGIGNEFDQKVGTT